jgi:hypothetical protein
MVLHCQIILFRPFLPLEPIEGIQIPVRMVSAAALIGAYLIWLVYKPAHIWSLFCEHFDNSAHNCRKSYFTFESWLFERCDFTMLSRTCEFYPLWVMRPGEITGRPQSSVDRSCYCLQDRHVFQWDNFQYSLNIRSICCKHLLSSSILTIENWTRCWGPSARPPSTTRSEEGSERWDDDEAKRGGDTSLAPLKLRLVSRWALLGEKSQDCVNFQLLKLSYYMIADKVFRPSDVSLQRRLSWTISVEDKHSINQGRPAWGKIPFPISSVVLW